MMPNPFPIDLNNPANSPAKPDWGKFTPQNFASPQMLPAGAQLSPAAGILADVTTSSQWQQSISTRVAGLSTTALGRLQNQVTALQSLGQTQVAELNTRVATINQQVAGLQDAARVAASPPALTPAKDSFQLGVKVVDQQSNTALPGLTVRLHTVQAPDTAINSATTDANGNATFTISKGAAKKLQSAKGDLTVSILTSNGTVLHAGDQTVSPVLNQAEGMFIPLPASADTQPSLAQSSTLNQIRLNQITALNARVQTLTVYYQQKQSALQSRIQYLQSVITQLTPAKT